MKRKQAELPVPILEKAIARKPIIHRISHIHGHKRGHYRPKNNRGKLRNGWLIGRATKRVDTRHKKNADGKEGTQKIRWTS